MNLRKMYMVLLKRTYFAMGPLAAATATACGFKTGSAPVEVTIPGLIPVVLSTGNPDDTTLDLLFSSSPNPT